MPISILNEFIQLASISSPSQKEGELAAYLKKRLADLGADVYEDNSAKHTGSDTGNIIAVFAGDKSKPTVLLAAHMDTVEPTNGMVPRIKDGNIYSDGQHILGADDKAGIAVILGVLSSLHEDNTISHGPIEVLLTVQEEIGLIGVKNLDFELKSQYGYVLDGDGPVGTIVNASPSHVTLDLTIEGKAAHAGLAPELGINAIVVAAQAIAGIASGRLDEETTSNFGIISGGKGRNIVADQVNIKAEVRSRNKTKLAKETEKLIDHFSITANEYKARFYYKKDLAYESFQIDPAHPAITNAVRAGRELGIEVNLKATGGGLDANILNAKGITCVALGVGNDNPHTKEEYVIIDELEKGRNFLLEIIKQIAR
jgi:tripeptide aminopeptidase